MKPKKPRWFTCVRTLFPSLGTSVQTQSPKEPVKQLLEFTKLLTLDLDFIRISCIYGTDARPFVGQRDWVAPYTTDEELHESDLQASLAVAVAAAAATDTAAAATACSLPCLACVLLLLLMQLLLLLLLLLAARVSAAARGASISWLARAETRVLALSSPEIYFEISVFVGICGVFSKKNAHTAACTGPKTCSAVRFASFFRCFPVCVAFRIGICSVLAISRLSAHASFDLHLFLNSVRGFGGGDGGG